MRSVFAALVLAVVFALFQLVPDASVSTRVILGLLTNACGLFAAFAARDDLRERRLDGARRSQREKRGHVEQVGGHGETHTRLDAQAEQLAELTQTIRGQQANAHARDLKGSANGLAAEIASWYEVARRNRDNPPGSAQNAAIVWGNSEGDGSISALDAELSAEFARRFAGRAWELRDSFAGLHMRDHEIETIFARADGYSSRAIYVAINGLRDLAERVQGE